MSAFEICRLCLLLTLLHSGLKMAHIEWLSRDTADVFDFGQRNME